MRFLVPDTVRFQATAVESVAGKLFQLYSCECDGHPAVDDLLHHVGVHLRADPHYQPEFGTFAVRTGVPVQRELFELCVLDRYPGGIDEGTGGCGCQ